MLARAEACEPPIFLPVISLRPPAAAPSIGETSIRHLACFGGGRRSVPDREGGLAKAQRPNPSDPLGGAAQGARMVLIAVILLQI